MISYINPSHIPKQICALITYFISADVCNLLCAQHQPVPGAGKSAREGHPGPGGDLGFGQRKCSSVPRNRKRRETIETLWTRK